MFAFFTIGRACFEGEMRVIGILSDSHDNMVAIKKAVRFFNETECDLVVHAGDIIAPFAACELQNLTCEVKAVFGNCDGERKGLEKSFGSFGIIKDAPFVFSHRNLRFLVTHIYSSLDSSLSLNGLDVLIFGHTHKPEMKMEGKLRLINPGESGGWVSGKSTVVLFDPESKRAEIITL